MTRVSVHRRPTAVSATVVPAVVPLLVALWAAAPRAAGAQPETPGRGSGSAIEGTVRDAASGRPLPNAQISVTGTTLGAATNDAGVYRIVNAPVGPGVQVRVRLIGYGAQARTVAVTLGQTARADFELTQSAIQLDQVVVTGTGGAVETKKLGNTIATIDASELRTAPIQNPSELLAARSPGVTVLPSGGTTGAGARIRIRGNASLSQSNNPVIYVDGVRADNGGSAAGAATSTSRLDDLDPSSIERVEILKGAAAATLYGTEASNGVIQIFTKRGTQGPARWSLELNRSQIAYPDRVAANSGFARTQAQADTLGRIFGQSIAPFQPFTYNVTKQLWETGFNNTVNGSVSGGAERVKYFAAGRYEFEDGPYTSAKLGGTMQDVLRRSQGTVSLDVLPTSTVTLGLQSHYTIFHIDGISAQNNIYSPYAQSMYARIDQAYCNDSTGLRRSLTTVASVARCQVTGNPFGNTFGATVRETTQGEIYQDGAHYTGAVTARWAPSATLSLNGTVGIDNTDVRAVSYYPFANNVDLVNTNVPLGSRSVDDLRTQNVTVDAKSNWTRHLGRRFESVLTLGAQGFVTTQRNESNSGRDFPGPGLAVTGAGSIQTAFEQYVRVVNAGYFGQEQLGFDDWVFATVGARYDYNSAFGESAGGVLYPKVSLSVVPFDRPGATKWTTLSSLRLRAALGRSGRQPGAFDKFTTYRAQNASTGSGLVPDNLGNQDLKPEITTEVEGGFDAGLFGDRAQVSATYWSRRLTDALVQKQFPISGGFTARQLTNVGRMDARGLELAVNGYVVNRPGLALDLFANGAYLHQKVVDLGGSPPIKVQASYVRIRGYIREGYAPGALFGAKILAPCASYANPASDAKGGCLQPGQTPFDLNNDRRPDTEQEVRARLATPLPLGNFLLRADDDGNGDFLDHYQGKPMPDWSGQFGGNLRLGRAWTLRNVFEYKAGNFTVTNLTDAFRNASPAIGRNRIEASEVEAALLNPASSAEQRYAAAQRWLDLVALSPYDGVNQNDAGDFVRWREVGLSYQTPRSIARRLGASDLTLSVAARNVALWTRYPGTDPESNYNGTSNSLSSNQTDNNFYESSDTFGLPIPRRLTVSARLAF
jgi:TonB-dependent starch-binding outer membrane protein SusC